MGHHVHAPISNAIWRALTERSRTSGQSVNHIVQQVLADALDIDHNAIFQVSTSGAIVQGLFEGCVSVGDLRLRGDVGLGTFEDLDGEMIMIDGHCYQARSDGTVVEASDDELTPFATIVNFAPDHVAHVRGIDTYDELTSHLDNLRTSQNGMVSIRATGTFRSMHLRTACKTEPGVDLVAATEHQALFTFTDMPGTLIGFWSPEYTKAISISGYHLHFISDDRQHGGHVLDLAVDKLFVELNDVNDVKLIVPETKAFLNADLSGDHTRALEIAEHSRGEK